MFWAPCGSREGAGGWGASGGMGGVPTHMHMHVHAHMCRAITKSMVLGLIRESLF